MIHLLAFTLTLAHGATVSMPDQRADGRGGTTVNPQDPSSKPGSSQNFTLGQIEAKASSTNLPDGVPSDVKMVTALDLKPGQSITKDEVSLTYRADGNLALVRQGPYGQDTLWSTGIKNKTCGGNCLARFQSDGNLVLLDGGKPYWNSGTAVKIPGSMLLLLNRAPFLAITMNTGAIRWSPASTQTWFGALDSVMNYGANRPGEADYLQLFADGFSWSAHMKNASVLKVYAQFLDVASDEQLKQVFKTLKKNHVGLAVESCMLSLGPNNCGIDPATNYGIEGYCMSADAVAARAKRVKDLGGDLAYVSIDEIYGANQHPSSCKQSIPDLATNAAGIFQLYQAQFPLVQLGDIENQVASDAGWRRKFVDWTDALAKATGKPLAFVHFDLDWAHQANFNGFTELRQPFKDRNTSFGVILNAKVGLASNEAWIQSAKDNTTSFLAAQAKPDHAVFQSWDSFPTKALPETSVGAHANLLWFYDIVGAEGVRCADVGATCTFTGQVRTLRYGLPPMKYVYKTFQDSAVCTPEAFGAPVVTGMNVGCDLLTTH